jgi:sulfatase modifying factor 1
MAEPEEPRRLPAGLPGGPIPRIWKLEPEPESVEEEAPKKKKKKGADGSAPGKSSKKPKGGKSSKGSGEGGEKGVLIEETPTLDTYEARRVARAITGVAILGLLSLIGFFIYSFVGSGNPEPTDVVDEAVPQSPQADPQQVDRESKSMLGNARALADKGNTELAVAILAKLKDRYPHSKAADDATAALDRSRRNLPLFSNGKDPVAKAATPAKPGAPASTPSKGTEVAKTAAPEPAKGTEVAKIAPAEAAKGEAALATPPPPAVAVAPKIEIPKPKQVVPPNLPPAGFHMREGGSIHPSGWANEIVGDRDSNLMVLIPGGSFTMGRDDGEPSEGPSHKTTMTPYYIDLHEVTNRQFDLFQKQAGKRTERTRAIAKRESDGNESEDSPVVMVTAREADEYAAWAGKQLPTEAQWEFAARGTDSRLYPWGTEPPNWAKPRKPRQIDPVLSFSLDTSPFGACDMAGNAWEWTRDWYDPKYHHQFRNAPAVNPTGPAARPKSHQLTVRGTAKNWIVTKRDGLRADMRLPYLGFRCVLPLDGAGPAPAAQPGQAPVPAQAAPNAGAIPF